MLHQIINMFHLLGVLKSAKSLSVYHLRQDQDFAPQGCTIVCFFFPSSLVCVSPSLPWLATIWTCPLELGEGQEMGGTGFCAQELHRVLVCFPDSLTRISQNLWLMPKNPHFKQLLWILTRFTLEFERPCFHGPCFLSTPGDTLVFLWMYLVVSEAFVCRSLLSCCFGVSPHCSRPRVHVMPFRKTSPIMDHPVTSSPH